MQTSRILAVLAGIFLVACNAHPSAIEISPQVFDVAKEAGSALDTYLINGFTSQARRLKNTPVSLQLGDLFFHIDKNTGITLKNVRLPTIPVLSAKSIQNDLKYLNAKVDLEAGNVVFEADYEVINSEVVKVMPLASTGSLTITLKNVRMNGLVGLAINNDILQATNIALDYQAEVNVKLAYWEDGEKVTSQITVDSIEKSLVKKVSSEMRFRMNDVVRAQLNVLLNQQSVNQLFLGNSQMVTNFKSHAARFTLNANSIIDQLLTAADAAITAVGLDEIEFPDIYVPFSWKIFIIRWHGSFTANKGSIHGLATFHRYKDASLSIEGNVATVFGGIGLKELNIGYSYYKAEIMGIGPTGICRVGVEDPAFAIKVAIQVDNWKPSLKDFTFDHTGHFKVDITGLEKITWLIEKIGGWIADGLRDFWETDVGQKIKDIIADIVSKFNPKPIMGNTQW